MSSNKITKEKKMAEIFDKIMTEIEKFLSQPGTKVNTYMEMIEKSTGIKRMYIAKGNDKHRRHHNSIRF